jgi:hypothetical protein
VLLRVVVLDEVRIARRIERGEAAEHGGEAPQQGDAEREVGRLDDADAAPTRAARSGSLPARAADHERRAGGEGPREAGGNGLAARRLDRDVDGLCGGASRVTCQAQRVAGARRRSRCRGGPCRTGRCAGRSSALLGRRSAAGVSKNSACRRCIASRSTCAHDERQVALVAARR